MNFYKWLKQYDGSRWAVRGEREGAVGDLRADVLLDDEWPRKATSRKECDDYLKALMGDTRDAELCLKLAWDMYRDQVPRSDAEKARRRAKKARKYVKAILATGRSVSPRRRFLVLKRDGYRCCLCGQSASDGTQLEVDHKVAVSRGGSNADENLWTLCFPCNRGKHADTL